MNLYDLVLFAVVVMIFVAVTGTAGRDESLLGLGRPGTRGLSRFDARVVALMAAQPRRWSLALIAARSLGILFGVGVICPMFFSFALFMGFFQETAANRFFESTFARWAFFSSLVSTLLVAIGHLYLRRLSIVVGTANRSTNARSDQQSLVVVTRGDLSGSSTLLLARGSAVLVGATSECGIRISPAASSGEAEEPCAEIRFSSNGWCSLVDRRSKSKRSSPTIFLNDAPCRRTEVFLTVVYRCPR